MSTRDTTQLSQWTVELCCARGEKTLLRYVTGTHKSSDKLGKKKSESRQVSYM